MLPTGMQTPNQLNLKVDDADYYLPYHHELITPSFTIRLVTVSLELRLLVSRAWVCCVPLSLAKQ